MSFWEKSATELAKQFADGDASAREIVKDHLSRIDEVNPKYNAVVNRIDELAIKIAETVDKAKANNESLGPLAGVPFTIKSNIDLASSPTTNGLPVFKEAIPATDAPNVERMKKAGAVPLARTNLPDFALRMQTDSCAHGLTVNPWNSDHTAGGSSGGEAVALATGMSPLD